MDPKDEEGFRLSSETRQRDEVRIRRFEEVQRRKRNWIKFTEIAEEYSERDGPVAPEKAAAEREHAFAMLEHDILAGNFEENGRSQVLFLFPGVTDRKMTRQRLQDAIDYKYDVRSYLENCWITRNRYERWREWHNMGKLPPRFRPQKSQNVSRAKSKALATSRDEIAATKALTSYLRSNQQLNRAGAQSWLRAQGFNLTERGFQSRVWPNAREQAGLGAKAPPGRPKKSSR